MPDAAPSRLFRALVPLGAAFALAGAGAFWWASQQAAKTPQGGEFTPVTVTTTACEPMEIAVAAGRRSFEIENGSDRPIEWEILDGVMVVAERENILPGFRQTLSVNLAPGEYAMTCGLLTNPRGVLRVTHSEEWASNSAKIGLRDFLGPLGEYKVYLIRESSAAIAGAEALQGVIAAGDLAAAQAAWIAARAPYRRIEPLAFRLSDMGNAIDPLAELLEGREADPGFTGYHRLEYGLFAERSVDGLAPFAEALVADLTELKARLSGFTVSPSLLISLPGDMARRLGDGKIEHGEDLYSGADLQDIAASLDGIAKLAGLLGGVIAPVDPALKDEAAAAVEKTRAALDGLKVGDGFPPYDRVDESARKTLAASFSELAATLARLQPAIGGL